MNSVVINVNIMQSRINEMYERFNINSIFPGIHEQIVINLNMTSIHHFSCTIFSCSHCSALKPIRYIFE